jgi:mevalonate kinase
MLLNTIIRETHKHHHSLMFEQNVQGLCVHIYSVNLPVGAGLGSSAAFSVAVAASFVRMRLLKGLTENQST